MLECKRSDGISCCQNTHSVLLIFVCSRSSSVVKCETCICLAVCQHVTCVMVRMTLPFLCSLNCLQFVTSLTAAAHQFHKSEAGILFS